MIKNQKGFTLIEAIITVAIVGILVVPISNLFMNALKYIQDSKVKLETTQLAQLYIENIHLKTNNELIGFLDANKANPTDTSVLINSTMMTNDYFYGFPKLPAGYKAEISYDFNTYTTYSDPAVSTKKFDFEISINTNLTNEFSVTPSGLSEKTKPATILTNRDIYIRYKYNIANGLPTLTLEPQILDLNLVDVNDVDIDGDGDLDGDGIIRVKINCKATDIGGYVTNIYTDNDFPQPIEIYVNNAVGNTVILNYITDGSINDQSIGSKMPLIQLLNQSSNGTSQMIYSVKVKIISPQGIVSELTTTKTDK